MIQELTQFCYHITSINRMIIMLALINIAITFCNIIIGNYIDTSITGSS